MLRSLSLFGSSNHRYKGGLVGVCSTTALACLLIFVWSCAAVAQSSGTAGGEPQHQELTSPAPVDPTNRFTCEMLQAAAGANNIPLGFFVRLIWQESRFDQWAISRAGAKGVAQFMPGTAQERHLTNPFDPAEALAKSAELLKALKEQFGNFGLAAAAYNAGPNRVQAWLAGSRPLPAETLAYVRIVTGKAAQEWARGQASLESDLDEGIPCTKIAKSKHTVSVLRKESQQKPAHRWFVQLFGDRSEVRVVSNYHQLENKHSALLKGAEATVLPTTQLNGIPIWHRIGIFEADRHAAEQLCSKLRSAGESCLVQRD
jgi:hypothetical protein